VADMSAGSGFTFVIFVKAQIIWYFLVFFLDLILSLCTNGLMVIQQV